MPELPELEAAARLLAEALAGARVESTLAPGVNALKSFDPPLHALDGRRPTGVRRRGKLLLLDFEDDLSLVVHLMSAGRLQLHSKRAGLRDRTSRVLLRLEGGSELRLREFGSRQAAWAKLARSGELRSDPALARLGPDAWPDPPPLAGLLAAPRPLHALLRDQSVLAGIGRTWVDEILHAARLSPFKRGDDLDPDEAEALRRAVREELDRGVAFYAERLPPTGLPDKLEKPVHVHGREGQACSRCGAVLEAVFYEDYVMAYCPPCQTGGRVLKDRRLSRLLK